MIRTADDAEAERAARFVQHHLLKKNTRRYYRQLTHAYANRTTHSDWIPHLDDDRLDQMIVGNPRHHRFGERTFRYRFCDATQTCRRLRQFDAVHQFFVRLLDRQRNDFRAIAFLVSIDSVL